MSKKVADLVIAVSSQSLFNFNDGDKIFKTEGQDAFNDYMRSKEDIPLKPGPAFPLVKKLLDLNKSSKDGNRLVEVVLLSRNSPDAGLRVLNSISHYNLDIEKASFCAGGDRFVYAKAFSAHLFLSTNSADVAASIQNGIASALLIPSLSEEDAKDPVVRIAFDGDSVLFSDEADLVYQKHGLEEFRRSESDKSDIPLGDGPFKAFLMALTHLQSNLADNKELLRLSLVTARGLPSHGRVINTLRHWNVKLDELTFCGGAKKGPILAAFGADIFFDDTSSNCASASDHGIQAGQVMFGTGHGIVG